MKYLILSLVVFFASCKAALDIKPRQDIPTFTALTTANDLEAATNGAVQGMQASGALGGAMKLIPDIISETVQICDFAYQRGQLIYPGIYYRNTFAAADNVWQAGYFAIERANNIIKAINDGYVRDPTDPAYVNNKDRMLGEALVVRAYMHFELNRLYAQQYGVNTSAANSGVILKIAPSSSREGQARATTEQVYNQIIADLRQASGLLPRDYDPSIHPRSYGGRVGGRITQPAAEALLARVFFQIATQAGNDSALARINRVMGSAPGAPTAFDPALDIIDGSNNFFFKRGNEAANQTIFQIVNNYNRFTNELSSTASTFLSAYNGTNFSAESPLSGIPPAYVGSEEFTALYGIYDQTKIGQRKNLYQIKQNSSTQYYVNKFPYVEGQPAVINLPVIRGAELILTRAEIQAAAGNLDVALADLNYIHVTANLYTRNGTGSNPTNLTYTDKADLINKIRIERIVELAFEGDRLHDFRRRHQAEINGLQPVTETPELGPGGYKANPLTRRNDFRVLPSLPYDATGSTLILQIPDAERFSNANVVINP